MNTKTVEDNEKNSAAPSTPAESEASPQATLTNLIQYDYMERLLKA